MPAAHLLMASWADRRQENSGRDDCQQIALGGAKPDNVGIRNEWCILHCPEELMAYPRDELRRAMSGEAPEQREPVLDVTIALLIYVLILACSDRDDRSSDAYPNLPRRGLSVKCAVSHRDSNSGQCMSQGTWLTRLVSSSSRLWTCRASFCVSCA